MGMALAAMPAAASFGIHTVVHCLHCTLLHVLGAGQLGAALRHIPDVPSNPCNSLTFTFKVSAMSSNHVRPAANPRALRALPAGGPVPGA
jgi:hypothetical protein